MKIRRLPKEVAAFFLLSLLWFAASCNKADTQFINVDPEVKDYFNYPVGTYWLMIDSATGQMDSFVVTDFKTIIATYSDYKVESIGITIRDIPNTGLNNANTWIIGIDNGFNTELIFRNTTGDLELPFTFFLPFPYKSNLPGYAQGSFTYTDCYNAKVGYSGGQTQYDSLFVRYISNKSLGFIKLASDYPGYNHTWQLMKFKRAT